MKLNISNTKDYFEHNGKGHFFLADTLWTAFSNIPMDEWEEYLEYRKMQNFNALQINILHQWDGGKSQLDIYPFKVVGGNKFDFYSINEKYFIRAQKMLEMAYKKGFTPALVVLWGSYVADTWMAKNDPDNVMPFDVVKPYSEYVVKMFSKFDPIYIVSGDTDFPTDETNRYYMTAMETIKELDPKALTTLHIGGEMVDIPEVFMKLDKFDFYMYQSGHGLEHQDTVPFTMAEAFYNKPVKRPIVNSEPCYEAHAFGGHYGRYNEFNVRKAIWQSLLSGAKAGITYGAHGVWGWYKEGNEFLNESFGGKPLPWRTALKLRGAWDASFTKWVFEAYDLFDLEPKNLIKKNSQQIRMSVSNDLKKVVIYMPYNSDVKVDMDLSGYEFILIELKDKYFAKPQVEICNGTSVIKMHEFNSDVLIIGTK